MKKIAKANKLRGIETDLRASLKVNFFLHHISLNEEWDIFYVSLRTYIIVYSCVLNADYNSKEKWEIIE